MAAPPARHRRALSMAAGRSRGRARQPRRARLWRLDRGRDGGAGAARLPPARAGRRDGRQAARGRHLRPGDRQLYRLRPRRLPQPGRVREGSTARSRPTSWSPGICAARCASASPGSRTCIRRPCRICWAACAPRRWSCGATTTRSCRRAPASSMPARCARRGFETVRDSGHCVDMEQPEALARLVDAVYRPELERQRRQLTSRNSSLRATARESQGERRVLGPSRFPLRRCALAMTAGDRRRKRHACDVFHRAADVGLSGRYRARDRPYRADVLEQAFRPGRRQPAL